MYESPRTVSEPAQDEQEPAPNRSASRRRECSCCLTARKGLRPSLRQSAQQLHRPSPPTRKTWTTYKAPKVAEQILRHHSLGGAVRVLKLLSEYELVVVHICLRQVWHLKELPGRDSSTVLYAHPMVVMIFFIVKVRYMCSWSPYHQMRQHLSTLSM
jgi:hypothetical protein